VALCVTKQCSLVEGYQGFGRAIPQGCTNPGRQVAVPLNIDGGAECLRLISVKFALCYPFVCL